MSTAPPHPPPFSVRGADGTGDRMRCVCTVVVASAPRPADVLNGTAAPAPGARPWRAGERRWWS